MRSFLAIPLGALLVLAACGPNKKNGNGDDDAGPADAGPPDACVGIGCMVVDCTGQGIGTTRLSGVVYAPNGTLPLYNATVYIPLADPGPISDQLTCDKCADALPGQPLVQTTTDETGTFHLDNVPVVDNLPVIIQIGKWRRQLTLAAPNQCADNQLSAVQTSLPKDHTQGDMPRIAITTGNYDSLECLIRKLGIADSEISTSGGAGHVHLYSGNGSDQFQNGFAGGSGSFADAQAFWSSLADLKKYDILMLSCEGDWPSKRSAGGSTALQAVYDYANAGGRVFMSHWHNYWLVKAPQPWPSIAQFKTYPGDGSPGSVTALVNEGFDRGKAFATWLVNVQASTVKDELPITEAKNTCDSVTALDADAWVNLSNSDGPGVQDFQFTTPNDKAAADRCGKVVFSDMHVSGEGHSNPGTPGYPSDCDTGGLSPQEKALAFMFFDIASCVGPVVN